MAAAAEALMPSFSSQNMSNAAMAFAKLDFHPGSLLHSIAESALAKLDTFTPQVHFSLISYWNCWRCKGDNIGALTWR